MKKIIQQKLQDAKENETLRELAETFLHQGVRRDDMAQVFNHLAQCYQKNHQEKEYNILLDTLDFIVASCGHHQVIKLHVGTPVTLTSTGEVGMVVHSWVNHDMQCLEYYVAFFGDQYPVALHKPKEKPYILRYLETSLEVIKTDNKTIPSNLDSLEGR